MQRVGQGIDFKVKFSIKAIKIFYKTKNKNNRKLC